MRDVRGRTIKRCAMLAAWSVGAACLLAILYLAAVHAYPGDSDSASVVLEGQAMAHGHLLLHGWQLSLDSFWTVDAPFYLVATIITGVRGALIFAVPAAVCVLIIGVGIFMAAEKRRGAAAVAAGAVVIAILGLPGHVLSVFFVHAGWHVTTALFALVAFLVLRKGLFGWAWFVGLLALIAGMLGDLMIIPLAVAPLLGAGLVAMMRTRSWRGGLPTVSAPIVATVAAILLRKGAVALGAFSTGKANRRPPLAQVVSNIGHGLHQGVILLGVGSSYLGLGGEPSLLSLVHVIAVVVVFIAVAAAVGSLLLGALRGRQSVAGGDSGDAWRLDDMLLIASAASFVTFVLLALAPDMKYSRYLTGGVIFGTILAGRVVGRLVERLRASRAHRAGWARRAIAAFGAAIVLCFAAGLIVNISQPVPAQPAVKLTGFLEAHHLTRGIGDYWSASIVTVASRGHVKVRPVISSFLQVPGPGSSHPAAHATVSRPARGARSGRAPRRSGGARSAVQAVNVRLVRYGRESADGWYTKPFQFLVYNYRGPWGDVTSSSADVTFGEPVHVYLVGPYQVMVWPHDLVVPAHGAASGGSRPARGLTARHAGHGPRGS